MWHSKALMLLPSVSWTAHISNSITTRHSLGDCRWDPMIITLACAWIFIAKARWLIKPMQHGNLHSLTPHTAMRASTSTSRVCNGTRLMEASMDGWVSFDLLRRRDQGLNDWQSEFSVWLVAWRTAAVLELCLLQLLNPEQLRGGWPDSGAGIVASWRQERDACFALGSWSLITVTLMLDCRLLNAQSDEKGRHCTIEVKRWHGMDVYSTLIEQRASVVCVYCGEMSRTDLSCFLTFLLSILA